MKYIFTPEELDNLIEQKQQLELYFLKYNKLCNILIKRHNSWMKYKTHKTKVRGSKKEITSDQLLTVTQYQLNSNLYIQLQDAIADRGVELSETDYAIYAQKGDN